jgi:futalosine hydrolase
MPAIRGAATLILVPTPLELARIEDRGGFPPGVGIVATTGFGPIAAAARTSALLARLTPARVLLVGIAGSYDTSTLPIGSAAFFASVAIEGVGAGEGDGLRGPPALGFPQWPGGADRPPILDEIELAPPPREDLPVARLLLTTCAASAARDQAAGRKRRFPSAAAEDMEGFGVALACALEGVPLTIVRGISNEVGDREPARWRIPAALDAARELALAALRG